MNWEDISKIAVSVLVGFGGIAGLIALAVKFSVNQIADRLSKKYEVKLNKELEAFKNQLDKKNYISKTRFDAEFSIYRELSKAFFEMMKNVSILIPTGVVNVLADKDARKEYENKIYSFSCDAVILAQDALHQNAPFIPLDYYEQFNEILVLCKTQLHVFELRWDVLYLASQTEKEKFSLEDYRRTDEIREKLMDLNNSIREHLATLDIA